jgi:hypothetical protein
MTTFVLRPFERASTAFCFDFSPPQNVSEDREATHESYSYYSEIALDAMILCLDTRRSTLPPTAPFVLRGQGKLTGAAIFNIPAQIVRDRIGEVVRTLLKLR